MGIMLIQGERMDDELLFSYMTRLASINGFTSVLRFKNYLLGHPLEAKVGYLRYDSAEYIACLFEQIDGLDWTRFFLDSTIYSLIAPLYSRAKQAALVNTCFIRKDNLRFRPFKFIEQLKSCPECRKEMNEKYGFIWYKKTHNLPFVTTCPKHGCRLDVYSGKRGSEFELNDFKPLEVPLNEEFDKFIWSLSESALDCSLEDLLPEITKVFYTKGVDKISEKLASSGLRRLYGKDTIHVKGHGLRDELNWKKILILLYICFDKVENIPVPVPDRDDIEYFMNASKGYKVFHPFRENLLEMEHEACGTHFLTTMQGFMNGMECPLCQSYLTDDELFKYFVSMAGNGEYKVLGDFTSLKDRVEVRHSVCGQTMTPKIRNILFEGPKCTCNTLLKKDEAQKRVEPMKLIRFRSTENNATFRCPDCGKTFTMKYRNYIKHPHCRRCGNVKANAFRTNNEFAQDLKAIVGDEYVLVGDYVDSSTKITLLHKKCGKTFQVSPVDFFQGTRCPNCLENKYMREEDFKKFVHEVSLGIYEASTKAMDKDCIITNTRTGEQMKMSRLMVMQELRRPTPSKKLPLDQKGTYEFMSRSAQTMKYINENYSRREIIFAEDVKVGSWDNQDKYPRDLMNAGFLDKITDGAFCFPGEKFTLEEYLHQKYIVRKGHHIGFIYGNELAYRLGIIDEKPPYHMIITNKESQTHGRKTKAMGVIIKIKGCDFTITDNNWQLLQMVNLIEGSYRFGWNVDKAVLDFMERSGYTINDLKKYIRKPHILKKLRRIVEHA